MHVARLLPASIRRAFQLMKLRFLAVFADAPVLFFAVVIGVALAFRVGVGAVRDAATPEPIAPTFTTSTNGPVVTGPEPGLPSMGASATAAAGTAEVGAAAKVQPIGTPSPARVAPRPRGHGRRPIRGGGR